MLAEDHFKLSVFSNIILFGWVFFQNVIIFAAIFCGVVIGCFLPDTDLPKSRIDYMGSIARFFSIISKNFLNPLIVKIFEFFLKQKIYQHHRGMTHTFYGILTYCLLIEIISIPIIFWLGMEESIIAYSFFVFGLFFGGILHLMEDSCTISGILPFYPLNQYKKYSGNISTSNLKEKRPTYYFMFLVMITGFLLYIQFFLKYPVEINIFLSVVLFLFVWTIIIWISKR
jgi:inner membrane protein